DTLADNDFELLLFRLPVAHIPAVDADRDGTIGDGQPLPVRGTAVDKRPLLLAQLVFTALGYRKGMVLDGRRIECRLHGEKVFQGLGGQAVGHQRGPLRLHEEQLRRCRLREQGAERTERGRLVALTGTLIQAWTRQGDGAKEGTERARLLSFVLEGRPTVVTL